MSSANFALTEFYEVVCSPIHPVFIAAGEGVNGAGLYPGVPFLSPPGVPYPTHLYSSFGEEEFSEVQIHDPGGVDVRSMSQVLAKLARLGLVPVIHGAPAERREPELIPRDNLPTVVVPVPLDAYLHVIMPDLTADDLRLDRLLIYLYETRPLQQPQAADEQETQHQRRDQYSVCHALHYPSIHPPS